jgi:hypothetical protein
MGGLPARLGHSSALDTASQELHSSSMQDTGGLSARLGQLRRLHSSSMLPLDKVFLDIDHPPSYYLSGYAAQSASWMVPRTTPYKQNFCTFYCDDLLLQNRKKTANDRPVATVDWNNDPNNYAYSTPTCSQVLQQAFTPSSFSFTFDLFIEEETKARLRQAQLRFKVSDTPPPVVSWVDHAASLLLHMRLSQQRIVQDQLTSPQAHSMPLRAPSLLLHMRLSQQRIVQDQLTSPQAQTDSESRLIELVGILQIEKR